MDLLTGTLQDVTSFETAWLAVQRDLSLGNIILIESGPRLHRPTSRLRSEVPPPKHRISVDTLYPPRLLFEDIPSARHEVFRYQVVT